jgi:hypothetical protein
LVVWRRVVLWMLQDWRAYVKIKKEKKKTWDGQKTSHSPRAQPYLRSKKWAYRTCASETWNTWLLKGNRENNRVWSATRSWEDVYSDNVMMRWGDLWLPWNESWDFVNSWLGIFKQVKSEHKRGRNDRKNTQYMRMPRITPGAQLPYVK